MTEVSGLAAAILLRAYKDVGVCGVKPCGNCGPGKKLFCDPLAFWRSHYAELLCDVAGVEYSDAVAAVQRKTPAGGDQPGMHSGCEEPDP